MNFIYKKKKQKERKEGRNRNREGRSAIRCIAPKHKRKDTEIMLVKRLVYKRDKVITEKKLWNGKYKIQNGKKTKALLK